jgi:hypothetical protein
MRGIAAFIVLTLTFVFFSGCRSINVGGSGSIGTVSGSGTVNIPVPPAK